MLGLTFKENCADLRNSKVVDIIRELQAYGVEVFVHDPQADAEEAMHEYGVRLVRWDDLPRADAIVAAVAHREFREPVGRGFLPQGGQGRLLHRRQGGVRRGRAGCRGLAGLAALVGIPRDDERT